MKEMWGNLDGSPKNKELWSYVVKFGLVGRKVAQNWTLWFIERRTQHILVTVIWRQTYG